ncbi:hypothetical protein B9Z55_020581 [Caenorhabditis nigoni]|uniref:F-box domain-containing protein n=1 Tax=Caenorhabditis nigoni TaxID=1611254 RepID=A0A2G5TNB5_9PELO|nr:hypothetical protein B9Z55_020581 [Caenorhabditis nigoni]
MSGWSSLAPETKQKVVEKLDLMSRIALGSTCRADRDIVNSTKLYIPRVRIAKNEDDCLLMIYSGVNRFLRMEFAERADGVLISRSQNSFDPKHKSFKLIPFDMTFGTSTLAMFIAVNVLSKPNILVGTIEWNNVDEFKILCDLMFNEFRRTNNFIVTSLDNLPKIRVKNVEVLGAPDSHLLFFKLLCNKSVLEKVVRVGIVMNDVWRNPRIVSETSVVRRGDEHLSVLSGILMRDCAGFESILETLERALDAEPSDGDYVFHTIRDLGMAASEHFDLLDVPVQKLNEKVTMKRFTRKNGTYVIRFNKSACGFFIHAVLADHENKFLELFQKQTCGIGPFCKKCADSFDYWHYSNITRRIFHEPKWTETPDTDSETLTKESMESEIIIEKRKLKEMEEQNKSIKYKPWGFRNINPHMEEEPEILDEQEAEAVEEQKRERRFVESMIGTLAGTLRDNNFNPQQNNPEEKEESDSESQDSSEDDSEAQDVSDNDVATDDTDKEDSEVENSSASEITSPSENAKLVDQSLAKDLSYSKIVIFSFIWFIISVPVSIYVYRALSII